MLPVNVGTFDRMLRIMLGLFVVSLVFWGPKTMFGYLGFIPMMTGLSGYCPAYHIFGISTCRKASPQP